MIVVVLYVQTQANYVAGPSTMGPSEHIDQNGFFRAIITTGPAQARRAVVFTCSLNIFVIAESAVASVQRFDDILTHTHWWSGNQIYWTIVVS